MVAKKKQDFMALQEEFSARVDKARKKYASVWDGKKGSLKRQENWLRKLGTPSVIRNPVALQAVADNSPVKSDMFDVMRYMRATRPRTIVGSCIQKAEEKYEPFSPLGQHTWAALFAGKPEMREEPPDPAPEWSARHKELMGKLIELPQFQSLAKKTQYRPLSSSIALMELTPTLLELVQEMQEKEKEDNGGGDGPGEGDGQGQPKDGNDPGQQPPQLTPQQVQALGKACDKAQKETEDAESNMRGCGMEPPTDEDLDPAEYMEYLKEFETEDMQKLLKDVGRLGKVASKAAKQAIPGFAGRGSNRFYGDRIELLPEEMLLNMVCPEMEDTFMLQLAGGELPQCVEQEYAPPGRGPVVFCIDESGSMSGQQLHIAKALAVASIRTAKEHNRASWAVSFCTEARTHDTRTLKGMTDFMTPRPRGGTSFVAPLKEAARVIDKEFQAKQADILFLTDGCSYMSDEFKATFRDWKQRKGVRVFVVTIGQGSSASAFDNLADYTVHVDALRSNNKGVGKDAGKAFQTFWQHLADTPATHQALNSSASIGSTEEDFKLHNYSGGEGYRY